MIKRLLLPVLTAGLGVALLLSTPPSPAAESAEKIDKLIQQLGSAEFDEREKATEALDKIGEPALEALKKATASKDSEIRRRSEELVKKIETRSEGIKILQPTKIHLVYKDTPLGEALADFRKKSGYNLTLHDPENKLKDRKVTLDTGETTFWQAFDQFCMAANLTEAKLDDLLPKVQPPPGANPQPVRPRPVNRVQPANPPENQDKPVEKPAAPPKQTNTAQAPQAQAEAPQQKAVPQPVPAPPPPVAQPGAVRRILPANSLPLGQITLVDGKSKELPTDYHSAVRVRAMDKKDMFPAPEEGQMVLGLQVLPEPKLTWLYYTKLTITKAVDDKDQVLAQGNQDVPNPPPVLGGPRAVIGPLRPGMAGAGNGIHHEIPVYLKKGEKASKSLKELTGVIQAQVLAPAKAVITTEDVFKSAGKTFHGGEKGSIKIIEATKDNNGQVTVRFELQMPADFLPANVGNNANAPVPNIRVPVQPPVPLKPAQPGGGLQVGQGAIQGQPAIQIAMAPMRPVGSGFGIEVIDEKGNSIPATVRQRAVANPNGGVQIEQTAIFQLPKDQNAAKLVFSGTRNVAVEIPFTLKNVTLP